MGRRKKTGKHSRAKTILRLPDLEQSRNAVLNSLAAASSHESYAYAIDEFIGWYSSAPRLAFNRSVVLRYRFFLEQKNLAPSTINVPLAAVRRLAFEAADTGVAATFSLLTARSFFRMSQLTADCTELFDTPTVIKANDTNPIYQIRVETMRNTEIPGFLSSS